MAPHNLVVLPFAFLWSAIGVAGFYLFFTLDVDWVGYIAGVVGLLGWFMLLHTMLAWLAFRREWQSIERDLRELHGTRRR